MELTINIDEKLMGSLNDEIFKRLSNDDLLKIIEPVIVKKISEANASIWTEACTNKIIAKDKHATKCKTTLCGEEINIDAPWADNYHKEVSSRVHDILKKKSVLDFILIMAAEGTTEMIKEQVQTELKLKQEYFKTAADEAVAILPEIVPQMLQSVMTSILLASVKNTFVDNRIHDAHYTDINAINNLASNISRAFDDMRVYNEGVANIKNTRVMAYTPSSTLEKVINAVSNEGVQTNE